jgi:hypothetical protein
MAGYFNLVNEWTIREIVLLSLGAHIVLVLFAGIRRREATGWRTLVLWLAYQVANWAAPYALSSLLSQSSTSRQQQLVAFWMPFLLMHLGGADNITAYSLEDSKLSMRQALSTVLQLLGTSYAIYKKIYVSGAQGTLLWASMVMVALGVAKYFERAWALRKGDFDKMRSSASNKSISFLSIEQRGRVNLNNEKALLIAHELLHITKGAFADYSVDGPTGTSRMRLPYSAKDMREVVEMELSLMYDILYTKAPVIHTWGGYLLRVASPITTATVTMLFLLDNKHGQRRADVVITYTLLVTTFLLELWWLLNAAASTWTYAFFNARPSSWLHHELLCSRRWHRLRQFVASLDPQQRPRGGYRLWSRTIGQYNLLQECTHHDTSSLSSRLLKKVAAENIWMEYHYSKSLKKIHFSEFEGLLFSKIHEALNLVDEGRKKMATEKEEEDAAYQKSRSSDEELGFFPEFQELILIWHVATDIFLLSNPKHVCKQDPRAKAIKALSDYLTFLAVVRSDMLPGLKLRSLYDVTRQALERIWQEENDATSPSTRDKGRLASILRTRNEEKLPGNDKSVLYGSSVILSDATKYAEVLLRYADGRNKISTKFGISKESKKRLLFLIPRLNVDTEYVFHTKTLLWDILDSWVRILIFVSTRCGRDSHAKQLARGCELTTIVWILREHACMFTI